MNPPQIAQDEISARAHEIWEQAGRPEGQELDHWLRAERELQAERNPPEEMRRTKKVKKSA